MQKFLSLMKHYRHAVAVVRHAPYVLQPLIDQCEGDESVALARNYAELEHPGRFVLTKQGVFTTWQQGELISATDLAIHRVNYSQQGRGTETGVRLAEGIAGVRKHWPECRDVKDLNYPVYEYEPCLAALRTLGGLAMVSAWMNGQVTPQLIRDESPSSFRRRVLGRVDDALIETQQSLGDVIGLTIEVTHSELCMVISEELIYHHRPGSYSMEEKRFPKYNHGILVVREDDGALRGFPFNERWEILKPD